MLEIKYMEKLDKIFSYFLALEYDWLHVIVSSKLQMKNIV